MKQDFKDAFGLGDSERMINSGDLDGVNLAAVQALARRNQDLEDRVARLEARLSSCAP